MSAAYDRVNCPWSVSQLKLSCREATALHQKQIRSQMGTDMMKNLKDYDFKYETQPDMI